MLQQTLGFNREGGLTAGSGNPGKIHTRPAPPETILGFLVPGEIARPRDTLVLRARGEHPGGGAGLALIDTGEAGHPADAQTLYAVQAGPDVRLVRGYQLPAARGEAQCIGRVLRFLAGATALRYIPNLHLLACARRRRRGES